MPGLREKIQSLRLRNIDSKYFIPDGSLELVLTNEAVQEAVMECNLKEYRRSEIASSIVQGGRKTFAILIMIRQAPLILEFVEQDQFQESWLDSRLPLSLPALESILSHTDAIDFDDKQWEFVSPVFSLSKGHRHLDDNTILPFCGKPRQRGDGGFGLVSEIDVHPNHVPFAKVNDNKVRLVHMIL